MNCTKIKKEHLFDNGFHGIIESVVRAEKSAKLISSSEWKKKNFSACFCKLIVYSREILSGKV